MNIKDTRQWKKLLRRALRYSKSMPIFEYSCDDCGTRFEKLLRRVAEANDVRCPDCGQEHLTTQYSTFAAHAKSGGAQAQPANCGAGACGSGACGTGMCGMNFN